MHILITGEDKFESHTREGGVGAKQILGKVKISSEGRFERLARLWSFLVRFRQNWTSIDDFKQGLVLFERQLADLAEVWRLLDLFGPGFGLFHL